MPASISHAAACVALGDLLSAHHPAALSASNSNSPVSDRMSMMIGAAAVAVVGAGVDMMAGWTSIEMAGSARNGRSDDRYNCRAKQSEMQISGRRLCAHVPPCDRSSSLASVGPQVGALESTEDGKSTIDRAWRLLASVLVQDRTGPAADGSTCDLVTRISRPNRLAVARVHRSLLASVQPRSVGVTNWPRSA
jgi:hypothetical protein